MLATLLQPCTWSLGLLVTSWEISLSHAVLDCIWNMEFCLSYLECGVSYFGYIISASNISCRQITSLKLSGVGTQPIGFLNHPWSVEESTFNIPQAQAFPISGYKLFSSTFCFSSSTHVAQSWAQLFSCISVYTLSRILCNETQHFVTLVDLGFPNVGNSPTFLASGTNYNERRQRSKKVCKVLDYGVVASKTSDIGPPILSAFAACKSGGTSTTHWLEAER